MQNVAQAYKQTQADTVSQGEVVVMLYDGALRYLARARDKIEAKDVAAKGILISKAIDVINELDGCLNMEAGGEVSRNLHQLYFLCNTRLLQANLKLDISILDSVVAILSGLRSAFAEILDRPEAQAAAASIGAKAAVSASNLGPRPLTTGHTPGIASPLQASGMYMQQSIPPGKPLDEPVKGPEKPLLQAVPLFNNQVTNGVPVATPRPVAPTPLAPAKAESKQEAVPLFKTTTTTAPPSTPATPTAPKQEDTLVAAPPLKGGLAGKKLSAYTSLLKQ